MVNGFALVANVQGFSVVAFTLADITLHVDIREEMHLYLNNTIAVTGLTTSTFYIEAEASRGVTTGASLLSSGKEFTNGGE